MAETTGIEPATLFRGDCFPSSFLTVRIVSVKMAVKGGIEPPTLLRAVALAKRILGLPDFHHKMFGVENLSNSIEGMPLLLFGF
jgi:hypothetical protein